MTTRPTLRELYHEFLEDQMETILAAEPDELEDVFEEAFFRRFAGLVWLDVSEQDILRRELIAEIRREYTEDLRRERRLLGLVDILEALGIEVADANDPEVIALDARRRGVIL